MKFYTLLDSKKRKDKYQGGTYLFHKQPIMIWHKSLYNVIIIYGDYQKKVRNLIKRCYYLKTIWRCIMKFIRLLSKDDKMFSEAMKLYGKSFPSHEQREIESQKEILKDEEYHFDLIYDNDSNAILAAIAPKIVQGITTNTLSPSPAKGPIKPVFNDVIASNAFDFSFSSIPIFIPITYGDT